MTGTWSEKLMPMGRVVDSPVRGGAEALQPHAFKYETPPLFAFVRRLVC